MKWRLLICGGDLDGLTDSGYIQLEDDWTFSWEYDGPSSRVTEFLVEIQDGDDPRLFNSHGEEVPADEIPKRYPAQVQLGFISHRVSSFEGNQFTLIDVPPDDPTT